MRYGDLRVCFEGKGKRIQLWRYDTILINWNFFSFFELINNFPCILWDTAYNISFLPFYIGLDMWIFSVAGHSGGRGKITKHHKKADSLPPPVAQQIQFGNPPSLLVLINRHSLAIFLWVNSFFTYVRFICVLLILWSNFYLTRTSGQWFF